jgi:Zn-dependent peptidase ImmA (M78 family)
MAGQIAKRTPGTKDDKAEAVAEYFGVSKESAERQLGWRK